MGNDIFKGKKSTDALDIVEGRNNNDELDCLWKFEYVPASKWDANEVAEFVRGINGCSEYAESFVSHEIDGYALMLVKEEHLVLGLKMKLGPALKLVGRVNQMKAEALEENLNVKVQRATKPSHNNLKTKSESPNNPPSKVDEQASKHVNFSKSSELIISETAGEPQQTN